MTLAEEKEVGKSTSPSLAPTLQKDPKSDLDDSATEKENASYQETPPEAVAGSSEDEGE